jgi:hypothetical protein
MDTNHINQQYEMSCHLFTIQHVHWPQEGNLLKGTGRKFMHLSIVWVKINKPLATRMV